MANILERANDIINKRSEEKERQYGPFIECNKRAAEIATILCNKEITTEDIYKFQIALKLARESFAHKEDNLLDLVAYIGALNNFHEGEEPCGITLTLSTEICESTKKVFDEIAKVKPLTLGEDGEPVTYNTLFPEVKCNKGFSLKWSGGQNKYVCMADRKTELCREDCPVKQNHTPCCDCEFCTSYNEKINGI